MKTFYDIEEFPPLKALRENWRMIRQECSVFDRTDVLEGIDRDGKSRDTVAKALIAGGRPRWVKAWGEQKDKWLNWGMVVHDQLIMGDAGAPKTTALLRHIRGFKVAGLSLFKPGLLLPVHEHPELHIEGVRTFHLGLEVPPDHCYLNVNGEFVREEEGKAIIFDGSYPHYALNASSADRLILYCEFYPQKLEWVD